MKQAPVKRCEALLEFDLVRSSVSAAVLSAGLIRGECKSSISVRSHQVAYSGSRRSTSTQPIIVSQAESFNEYHKSGRWKLTGARPNRSPHALTGHPWGVSGPTSIRVCEGADVPVAKQPRDLRNRQIFVAEMALCKANAEFAQYVSKRESLRGQAPSERSRALPQFARDFAQASFSVGQQDRYGVLHTGAEQAAMTLGPKGFFTVTEQKIVEVYVRRNDG